MAAIYYFTRADLEDRVGRDIVESICDDSGDGVADDDVINRIRLDASSKVNGYLRPMYELPLSVVPNEVKRLALDVGEAMIARRHPEKYRRDWKALMEATECDLRSLRKGETRLDVQGPPEPAANKGGSVSNGSVTTPDLPTKFFGDGTGIF